MFFYVKEHIHTENLDIIHIIFNESFTSVTVVFINRYFNDSEICVQ